MANKAVALVLGQGPGNQIKQSIEKNLDNYRFLVFDTLPQMIKSSEDNEQFYSKIIVFELRLTEVKTETGVPLEDSEDPRVEALGELSTYLSSHSATEVVVICNTGDNFTNVSDYIDTYVNSPTVTPILPKSLQMPVFEDCASESISVIRSRYYTKDKAKAKTRTVKQADTSDEPKTSRFGRKNKKAKQQTNAVENMSSPVEPEESERPDSNYNDDEFAGPAGDLGHGPVDDSAGWGHESGSQGAAVGIAGGLTSLSFGDAGSNHEETGFLSEDDDFDTPEPVKQISAPIVEMPESGGFSQHVQYPEPINDFGNIPGIPSLPVEGGPLPEEVGYPEFNQPLSSSTSYYEAQQPVYDSEPSDVGYSEDGENEADDSPNILDRIILVTGDRGSGATTKAAELALDAVETGSGKVLLIDLDFRKHGALGLLDDFAGYIKSGPHTIISGKPYVENGLDILSDGHGTPKSTESIKWVEDSRNYANYSKIVIDCPLEFVSELGDFVSSVGIVYLVDGSQGGLMSTISVLDDRDAINNEVALTFRDKGLFCVIRKESNYREALAKLKGEVAVDRVDWLAKIV